MNDDFKDFVIEGTARMRGEEKKTRILRDTGANQSVMLRGPLPWTDESNAGREVKCHGAGGEFSVPLHKLWLECGYVTGEEPVGVKESLPVQGVDMLLGNDLAGSKVLPNLQMIENPAQEEIEIVPPAAAPTLAVEKD